MEPGRDERKPGGGSWTGEGSDLGLKSGGVDAPARAAAETEGRTCSKHRERSWYGVVHTRMDVLTRAVEGPGAE